ncbi:hypothetical protein DFH07DRAFT_1060250 [Mycena maculata]|uniref:Uncharacterized protein n=1 Tax=Mycena maculata TaxID=230809 RepID=A0AAD7J8J4_9AGAR|nr:hypothetical protein DFH07DRAFT_1060250 [Mycena maculata]
MSSQPAGSRNSNATEESTRLGRSSSNPSIGIHIVIVTPEGPYTETDIAKVRCLRLSASSIPLPLPSASFAFQLVPLPSLSHPMLHRIGVSIPIPSQSLSFSALSHLFSGPYLLASSIPRPLPVIRPARRFGFRQRDRQGIQSARATHTSLKRHQSPILFDFRCALPSSSPCPPPFSSYFHHHVVVDPHPHFRRVLVPPRLGLHLPYPPNHPPTAPNLNGSRDGRGTGTVSLDDRGYSQPRFSTVTCSNRALLPFTVSLALLTILFRSAQRSRPSAELFIAELAAPTLPPDTPVSLCTAPRTSRTTFGCQTRGISASASRPAAPCLYERDLTTRLALFVVVCQRSRWCQDIRPRSSHPASPRMSLADAQTRVSPSYQCSWCIHGDLGFRQTGDMTGVWARTARTLLRLSGYPAYFLCAPSARSRVAPQSSIEQLGDGPGWEERMMYWTIGCSRRVDDTPIIGDGAQRALRRSTDLLLADWMRSPSQAQRYIPPRSQLWPFYADAHGGGLMGRRGVSGEDGRAREEKARAIGRARRAAGMDLKVCKRRSVAQGLPSPSHRSPVRGPAKSHGILAGEARRWY